MRAAAATAQWLPVPRSDHFDWPQTKDSGHKLDGGRLIVSAAATTAGSLQPSTAISQLQMPNANYNNYCQPFRATPRRISPGLEPIIPSSSSWQEISLPLQTCINQSVAPERERERECECEREMQITQEASYCQIICGRKPTGLLRPLLHSPPLSSAF